MKQEKPIFCRMLEEKAKGRIVMNYHDILGEFTNALWLILIDKAPELDPNVAQDIRVEAESELCNILIKYKLIETID